MPIYEYKCNNCGKEFEILYRNSEDTKCECGSENLEKLVSKFGIKITGTHFVGEKEKKDTNYEQCSSCPEKCDIGKKE